MSTENQTAMVTTVTPTLRYGRTSLEIPVDALTDDSVEFFGWYACTLFAVELHVLTGGPYAVVERWNPVRSEWQFAHVGLHLSPVRMLDIEGLRNPGGRRQRLVPAATTHAMRERIAWSPPEPGESEEDHIATCLGLPPGPGRFLARRQAQVLLDFPAVTAALTAS